MKIFNIENNKETAYIQNTDLESLKYYNGPIPETLLLKNIDGEPYEFISIDRPAEIQFLKDAYWIINITEMNQSEDDLIEKGNNIARKMNSLAYEHNSEQNETQKSKLLNKHKLFMHQMHGYADLVFIKKGQLIIPMPNLYTQNELLYEDIGYEIYSSINPYIVTIKRKDKNPFNSIPFDVVNQTIEILKQRSKFVTEYKYSSTLTPDRKSVIVTILFDKLINEDTKKIAYQPVHNIDTSHKQSTDTNGFIKMVQYMFKKH